MSFNSHFHSHFEGKRGGGGVRCETRTNCFSLGERETHNRTYNREQQVQCRRGGDATRKVGRDIFETPPLAVERLPCETRIAARDCPSAFVPRPVATVRSTRAIVVLRGLVRARTCVFIAQLTLFSRVSCVSAASDRRRWRRGGGGPGWHQASAERSWGKFTQRLLIILSSHEWIINYLSSRLLPFTVPRVLLCNVNCT